MLLLYLICFLTNPCLGKKPIYFNLSKAQLDDLLDFSFNPNSSIFIADKELNVEENSVSLITPINYQSVVISSTIGQIKKNLLIGDSVSQLHGSFRRRPHTTVHIWNTEIHENSRKINFLCHREFSTSTLRHPTCCIIFINASHFTEYSICSLHHEQTCHTSTELPIEFWKTENQPEISISYRIIYSTRYSINNITSFRNNALSDLCHVDPSEDEPGYKPLPPISIVKTISDAIREVGTSILLQIPRRELSIDEEFIVYVRLKHGADVSQFSLKFDVPQNTFVEFLRVTRPGVDGDGFGSLNGMSKSNRVYTWDIFNRTTLNQKQNATEIVARFRAPLIEAMAIPNRSMNEVYRIHFRVLRPPKSTDRIAPRILWSLSSLKRRNSLNHTVGGESPIVTRLNIESAEFKHIVIVMKSTAVVNTAALTGRPLTFPIRVFGLTHNTHHIVDVTDRAVCHTGDDAVIHFPHDSCRRLKFSGAELDGSPGLPLVAKLDGRVSTSTSLVVWFPKSPGLKLQLIGSSLRRRRSHSSRLIKALTSSGDMRTGGTPTAHDRHFNASETFFQFLRVRVLARFILAGTVLYDKDVLGGRTDRYVDVTPFVSHRLYLTHSPDKHSVEPLVLVPPPTERQGTLDRTTAAGRIWLVGNRPGRSTLHVVPLNQTNLRQSIPPGLVKQLKDQRTIDDDDQLNDGLPKLDIEISDDSSVWPVGMSAQIVVDYTINIAHQHHDTRSPVGGRLAKKKKGDPVDNQPPVTYSRVYHVHVAVSVGSQLLHSGSINGQFGGSDHSTTIDPINHRGNQSRAEFAILLIWLHMSDGSTMLWNQFNQVYRRVRNWHESNLPFLLQVKNLKPDIVKITESTNTGGLNRVRRAVPSSNYDSSDSSSEFSTWSDPVIWFRKKSFSFTGDLVELRLVSQSRRSLVQNLRIPLHIVQVDQKSPNPSSQDRDSLASDASKNWPHLDTQTIYESGEHNLMAHKDAPGFKQAAWLDKESPNTKHLVNQAKGNRLDNDDHSLSDQDVSRFSKHSSSNHPSATAIDQDGAVTSASSSPSKSRSALELSIYFLLGLFALVGLVFAVNCGAIVARSGGWQCGGGVNNVRRDQSSSPSPRQSPSLTQVAEQMECEDDNTSGRKSYLRKLLPSRRRRKSKPPFSRDDNWVWIGKVKNPSSSASSGSASRQLNPDSLQRSRSSPSPRCDRPSCSIVLSMGEGDPLLHQQHSPFNQHRTWSNGLFLHDGDGDIQLSDGFNTCGDGDPWISKATFNQVNTVGRRRQTTCGEESRRHFNYQGNECSICIISNPVSKSDSIGGHSSHSYRYVARDFQPEHQDDRSFNRSRSLLTTNHHHPPSIDQVDERHYNPTYYCPQHAPNSAVISPIYWEAASSLNRVRSRPDHVPVNYHQRPSPPSWFAPPSFNQSTLPFPPLRTTSRGVGGESSSAIIDATGGSGNQSRPLSLPPQDYNPPLASRNQPSSLLAASMTDSHYNTVDQRQLRRRKRSKSRRSGDDSDLGRTTGALDNDPSHEEGGSTALQLPSENRSRAQLESSNGRILSGRTRLRTDPTWDQDILALSHECLMAYFADMKESNA